MNINHSASAPAPSRELLRCALLLAVLCAAQLALLLLTTLLPQSAIAPHMAQAAEAYQNTEDFQIVWEQDPPSMLHHYADALLLNILWNQDGEHPLRSALDGAYYEAPGQSQIQNLADTLEGAPANTEYARYWHGMGVVLKPLLCLMTLSQLKLLGAGLLLVLAAIALALLLRQRQKTAAVSLAVGLVLCRSYLVPFCMEYYACFALALAGMDWVLLKKGQLERPWRLFLLLGALVCFFDFLTCEILTLGLPLLALLLLRQEDRRQSLKTAFRCCAAWLAAYALSWLCKWSLAALVLGKGVGEIALGQGIYRAAGSLGSGVNYGFQPLAAIVVNLSMLQPFQALASAPRILVAFAALALALFSLWFLLHKRENGPALALFLLALLPFVRFFCISNHAALHPFFTYRDFLLTMMALPCAMALSMARPGRPRPAGRRKGGRP